MKFDKLLVLDIDETLIYATKEQLHAQADFQLDFGKAGHYHVYKRPGLDRFLQNIFQRFEVGIWTSSGSDYAKAVLSNLPIEEGQLSFLLTYKDCTQKRNTDSFDQNFGQVTHLKKLKKLKRKGYPLEKIIMVDNTPAKVAQNYGNAVIVPDFQGDPEDQVLSDLWKYLVYLDQYDNIRSIEKRGWINYADEQV